MCRDCDWEDFLADADRVLDDIPSLPDRASEFSHSVQERIEGIVAWVEDNEHVTPKQKQALENMSNGVQAWLDRE